MKSIIIWGSFLILQTNSIFADAPVSSDSIGQAFRAEPSFIEIEAHEFDGTPFSERRYNMPNIRAALDAIKKSSPADPAALKTLLEWMENSDRQIQATAQLEAGYRNYHGIVFLSSEAAESAAKMREDAIAKRLAAGIADDRAYAARILESAFAQNQMTALDSQIRSSKNWKLKGLRAQLAYKNLGATIGDSFTLRKLEALREDYQTRFGNKGAEADMLSSWITQRLHQSGLSLADRQFILETISLKRPPNSIRSFQAEVIGVRSSELFNTARLQDYTYNLQYLVGLLKFEEVSKTLNIYVQSLLDTYPHTSEFELLMLLRELKQIRGSGEAIATLSKKLVKTYNGFTAVALFVDSDHTLTDLNEERPTSLDPYPLSLIENRKNTDVYVQARANLSRRFMQILADAAPNYEHLPESRSRIAGIVRHAKNLTVWQQLTESEQSALQPPNWLQALARACHDLAKQTRRVAL